MDYLSKSLNLKKEEIIKRMKRLYDERLIMYVMTPPMQLIGYGLYYWVVKLKEALPKRKSRRFRNGSRIRMKYVRELKLKAILIISTAAT